MNAINEKLCQLIKKAQGNRGQNQFAQQCDISSSSLTRISTGTYTPSAKFLAKIAAHAHNDITYEMLMNAAGFLTPAQQENTMGRLESDTAILSNEDLKALLTENDGIDFIERLYKELQEKQKIFVLTWLIGYMASEGLPVKKILGR